MPSPYLATVRQAIQKGKLKTAIELLSELLKDHDQERQNEVILLSSRLAALTKESRQGLIAPDAASVKTNQLSFSLLQFLNDLEEEEASDATLQDLTKKAEQQPIYVQHAEKIYNIGNIQGGANFS